MRLPTDDEIDQAARTLGIADDSGRCPRSKRSAVAKSLLEAVADDERQAVRTAGIVTVVDAIADVHHRLVDAGIGVRSAATITAALAPLLYQSAHERTAPDAAPQLDQPG